MKNIRLNKKIEKFHSDIKYKAPLLDYSGAIDVYISWTPLSNILHSITAPWRSISRQQDNGFFIKFGKYKNKKTM